MWGFRRPFSSRRARRRSEQCELDVKIPRLERELEECYSILMEVPIERLEEELERAAPPWPRVERPGECYGLKPQRFSLEQQRARDRRRRRALRLLLCVVALVLAVWLIVEASNGLFNCDRACQQEVQRQEEVAAA
jgi:hypothetical protein